MFSKLHLCLLLFVITGCAGAPPMEAEEWGTVFQHSSTGFGWSGGDGHAGEGQGAGVGAGGGGADHAGVVVVGLGHSDSLRGDGDGRAKAPAEGAHAFDVDARRVRGRWGSDAHRDGGKHGGHCGYGGSFVAGPRDAGHRSSFPSGWE